MVHKAEVHFLRVLQFLAQSGLQVLDENVAQLLDANLLLQNTHLLSDDSCKPHHPKLLYTEIIVIEIRTS